MSSLRQLPLENLQTMGTQLLPAQSLHESRTSTAAAATESLAPATGTETGTGKGPGSPTGSEKETEMGTGTGAGTGNGSSHTRTSRGRSPGTGIAMGSRTGRENGRLPLPLKRGRWGMWSPGKRQMRVTGVLRASAVCAMLWHCLSAGRSAQSSSLYAAAVSNSAA